MFLLKVWEASRLKSGGVIWSMQGAGFVSSRTKSASNTHYRCAMMHLNSENSKLTAGPRYFLNPTVIGGPLSHYLVSTNRNTCCETSQNTNCQASSSTSAFWPEILVNCNCSNPCFWSQNSLEWAPGGVEIELFAPPFPQWVWTFLRLRSVATADYWFLFRLF